MEVLERTACRGPPLTLVTRTVLRAAVWVFGWARQPDEAELADPHARPELDRQRRDVQRSSVT